VVCYIRKYVIILEGDIPVDVPTNQNIGGDVSPASPAALTLVSILLIVCKYDVVHKPEVGRHDVSQRLQRSSEPRSHSHR